MKNVNEKNFSMGERIRKARKTADLTQEKVAELIGVSTQYISELERGTVGAATSTIIRLSRVLCVSTDYILVGEKEYDNCAEELLASLSYLSPHEFDLVKKAVRLTLEAINTGNKL